MPDLSANENSLFGSSGLDGGSGPGGSSIAAPQFADLGGPLSQPGGTGILGGQLAPPPIHHVEDKSRTMSLEDDEFGDPAQKDFSHKLSVFHVYKNKKNFTESGFFNGGLDTGVEPSLLAVEFDTKE